MRRTDRPVAVLGRPVARCRNDDQPETKVMAPLSWVFAVPETGHKAVSVAVQARSASASKSTAVSTR